MPKLRDLKITQSATKALQSNKVRQVIDFLNNHYDIRINRFRPWQKEVVSKTKKFEFQPTVDDIILHLYENEIYISDTILRKILNSPNQVKNYDPISEYFFNLEKYKGDSHITKFCSKIKAVNYHDRVGEDYYQHRNEKLVRKWMVASVACGLREYQNEVSLGFIQEEEGTGKTTICKWLCPEPLKGMFILSDKDKKVFNMRTAFTENFLILFDEFIGLNQFTAENYKSTMSSDYIDIKEPHDPFPKRKPRIANAMFTTNNKTGNDKGFLYPGLGTRRFACLHIESIEYDAIMNDLSIDQMWAEAYMLLKGGFDYKWGPNDFFEFAEHNERFMIQTNAVQLIESNFMVPENGHDGSWMTPTDMLVYFRNNRLAGRDTLSQLTPEKIGIALRQLGYEKQAKKVEGSTRYPYYVKILSV
jgi:hypothetical protein